jgi:hypothetical protein
LIGSETFFEQLSEISAISKEIAAAYESTYSQLHKARGEAFEKAIDDIKGLPEWSQIAKDLHQAILAPLARRACTELDLSDNSLVCRNCRATLSQMDSDLAALTGLKAQVLARVHDLVDAEAKKAGKRIERIKVLDFFADALDSEAAVNEGIERLREHLQKLVAQGVKIILE